jgi:hypothetical protein
MIHRGIDLRINDLTPSAADMWQKISLSVGQVSAEMLRNLELEFSLLKLQEGEDTREFIDKLKDHREKNVQSLERIN